MALTKILLTLSLVALSNAVLMWPNDDGRFPPLPQNNYRRNPSRGLPLFPDFQSILSFPFNFVGGGGFPGGGAFAGGGAYAGGGGFAGDGGFTSGGVFSSIPFPSPSDITNTKPAPGQTYTGIFAHSGGGEHYIMANLNGHVVKYSDDGETASETVINK